MIKTDENIKNEISDLKVSVAEKLSWGAAGGAISGIIMKLLEMKAG